MGLRVRDGAMAGIVGAIMLALAGVITGSPPKPDDPTSKVVSFLVDKRTTLRWQLLLFAVGTLLLIWFTAAFCTLMTRGDVSGPFALLPLALSIAILSIGFAGGTAYAAVIWRGADHVDPRLAQLAWDGNSLATSFVSIAVAGIFFAAAGLVRRTRLLPSWVAWLALVAALVNVVAMLGVMFDADKTALAPGGVFAILALLLSMVWIAATSIVMLNADRA